MKGKGAKLRGEGVGVGVYGQFGILSYKLVI